MSKRRRASELIFSKKRGLCYPVRIAIAASGTGTGTKGGVITVVGGAAVTSAYLTVETATNKAVLIGTAGEIE